MIAQYRAHDNIRREIELLRKLSSKYVLKIEDTFEDAANLCIVLEYCNGGTLMDLIKRRRRLSEKEAFIYFYQICMAVDYLHRNNIAHRDIKVTAAPPPV